MANNGRIKNYLQEARDSQFYDLFSPTFVDMRLPLDVTGIYDNVVMTGKDSLVIGNAADNSIHVGSGFDRAFGGDGDDFIVNFGGEDRLYGEAGNDKLWGGEDADRLSGGDGNDELNGWGGNDTLLGGDGRDTLLGGAGRDSLTGGRGNDTLDGGESDDTLDGGDGADTLDGGMGNDIINGGNGDDRIIEFRYVYGSDTIDGGAGNDWIEGGAANDSLNGGDGNDRIYGDDAAFTDIGNDRLSGGAGNDKLYGGRGDDRLYGGEGDDALFLDKPYDNQPLGSANDVAYGGEGGDVFFSDLGRDRMYGGAGDDIAMIGNEANSFWEPRLDMTVFDGGDGIDTLNLSRLVGVRADEAAPEEFLQHWAGFSKIERVAIDAGDRPAFDAHSIRALSGTQSLILDSYGTGNVILVDHADGTWASQGHERLNGDVYSEYTYTSDITGKVLATLFVDYDIGVLTV